MFMPGVWILWSKKLYFVIIFQKENGNTFTLLIIFIVKSLQKEQNSTNLLLWPPICRNKHAITPKWFNSLDTNSRRLPVLFVNQTNLKRFRPLCPAPALALELWTDWGVRGKWGKKLQMLGKGQFSSENHPIGLNNTFERKKIRQIDLWHQKAVFSACYLPKSLDYT